MATWVLALSGCADPAEDSPAPTPEEQFTADGVSILEFEAGRIIWRGRMEHAAGDHEGITGRGLTLVRTIPGQDHSPMTVRAPVAKIKFDPAEAWFEDVVIENEEGATLTTRRATYQEKTGTIVAPESVEVRAQGLRFVARSAVVHVAEGQMDLAGPIEGRWIPD